MILNKRRTGNALMEYAVPMGIILVAAGVLATVVDINKLMGEYFMAGTGHTSSNLQGGKFKTDELAKGSEGSTLGNGDKFTDFGSITDGGGGAVAYGVSGGGSWGGGGAYSGAISRGGGRAQTAGGNGNGEIVYPMRFSGPAQRILDSIPPGAPAEYVARVTNLAVTTEQAGATGNTNPAALIAQQASVNGYAAANMREVQATGGGVNGLGGINDVTNALITTGANIDRLNATAMDGLDGRAIGANYDQWRDMTANGANLQIVCRDQGCNGATTLEANAGTVLMMTSMFGGEIPGDTQEYLTSIYGNLVETLNSESLAGEGSFAEFFSGGGTASPGAGGELRTGMEDQWDAAATAAAEAAAAEEAAANP